MEPLTGPDAGLVRVEYQYEPQGNGPDGNSVVRSGHVVLDPAGYWLIRRARVAGCYGDDRHAGTMTATYEYATDRAPIPVLTRTRLRETGVSRGKTYNADTTYEYDTHSLSEASAKQFGLAPFGISEPTRPGAARRTWIYANLLALLLIGIAVAFWWYRRHRGTRPDSAHQAPPAGATWRARAAMCRAAVEHCRFSTLAAVIGCNLVVIGRIVYFFVVRRRGREKVAHAPS